MSKSPVSFNPSTLPDLEGVQKVGSLDPRLSRTDYFDGRLLTATDLIRDQTYVDERVLEVGRALGSGVVRGLAVELSEDQRYLRVNPGLAISESGRVLEVTSEKPLEIDLYDRALLINLNKGRYQRFNRGLYAVTLQYVEMGSDSAESYPADPTEKNEFQYDSYVEGAEITLTPLDYPLPSDNELVSRSALVKHFLRNPGQPREVSDQAVSLGLLAMNNDRPQWLDTHMLRRPMRPEHISAAWQMDLHRHYLELLDSVMLQRASQSQDGEFAAAQYFHLLPPAGVLPMASVDPTASAQYFFPENYEVSISPVRYDDLPVIQSESMQLAPLDLDRGEAAEIMILAPMSNQEFMDNARRLGFAPEKEASIQEGEAIPNYWLHATDLLQLRLAADAATQTDNAAKVWGDIWKLIGQGNGLLHYVRRPARAAETQVSAVVLAHGFEIPDPADNLEAQINALKAERDTAVNNLAKANEGLQNCQAENEQLKKAIEDASSSTGDQSAKIAELEASITGLTNQLSKLTSQKEAAELARDNIQQQLEACKKELEACKNSQGGDTTGSGITACLRDPECLDKLLRNRGMRDVAQIDETSKFIGKVAERNPDNASIIWDLLGHIPPSHDKLLWPTLESAHAKDTLKLLQKIVTTNAQDLPKLEGAIAEQGADLGLPQEVIEGWAGKGPLAIGGQTGEAGLGDLQAVLDMRGTRDLGIRESADKAMDLIRKQPADLQSAAIIIKNVSGAFDAVLWTTMGMASKSGSLQVLEEIALANADSSLTLAKEIANNADKFSIDAATAEQWQILGSRLGG